MKLRNCGWMALVALVAGCTIDATQDDLSEEANTEVSAPASNAGFAHDDGWRDPCETGDMVTINGRDFWVPALCSEGRVPEGDPQPKEKNPVDRRMSVEAERNE